MRKIAPDVSTKKKRITRDTFGFAEDDTKLGYNQAIDDMESWIEWEKYHGQIKSKEWAEKYNGGSVSPQKGREPDLRDPLPDCPHCGGTGFMWVAIADEVDKDMCHCLEREE